jgi:anti-sigma B factor antagonist
MPTDDESLLRIASRDNVAHIRFAHARIEGAFVPDIERELKAVVNDEHAGRALVYFDNVTYMPTVALGVLISFNKRMKQRGGRVHLVGMRPLVRELFTISALDRVFPIHADMESALAEMD